MKINICKVTAILSLRLVLATDAIGTRDLRVHTTNMKESS